MKTTKTDYMSTNARQPAIAINKMNISDLKKICEDAEAYRKQVFVNIELPNGEDICFKVQDSLVRDEIMHECRRAGLLAWFHTLTGAVDNIDHAGRKEPFWGTKCKSK